MVSYLVSVWKKIYFSSLLFFSDSPLILSLLTTSLSLSARKPWFE